MTEQFNQDVRNKQIVEFYQESKDIQKTAREFGLGAPSIYRVLREHNVTLVNSAEKHGAISSTHRKFGININYLRQYKLSLTVSEFADEVGISKIRMSKIINGKTEPNLTEIEKLTLICDCSFDELISSRKA